MKLSEILEFRKDLFFEGAVQADWFYNPFKSSNVAENFVFHGSKYYGVGSALNNKRIDTVSFVKRIGEKISNHDSNPLSMAIADYGTGKSHLTITLAHLLSGSQYNHTTFDKVLTNIKNIDAQEAFDIANLFNERNLVLVINGMKDFNLHSELLKAAQKSLTLNGIDSDSLKKINKSIEIAERFFERNCISSISLFNKAAEDYGWVEKDELLMNKLRKTLLTNENAFNIINTVYDTINGHMIRWDEGLSATNIIEELINEYCGENGPFKSLIILFDEFGRYLEYASSVESGKSGDSALQQIFECTQNFKGKLHVVNFIQSDIKTYLQRVDNTKNISRYIGRYENSDKYYISSNLETVFANLIYRKNTSYFENCVVVKQNSLENLWEDLFDSINKWANTKGIWNTYELFRNVIVEGIYPMHPLSTYMLSQLSDYLQNRSSLTLISQYIQEYSDIDLANSYFQIYPEMLMKGNLFVEMLSAEQEGKQSSEHCIKYHNILRKYEDKLNDIHLTVLRSNLVLRVLKFKMSSLDDIYKGLSYCSGLTINEIKEAINFLENEYGVLGYDDRAYCFDFMAESSGAHDYKIIKKRLMTTAEYNPYLLTKDDVVFKLIKADTPIETNFDIIKGVSTSEWQFVQYLKLAEDIDEKFINKLIEYFENAKAPNVPKGQLVWIYANKNISPTIIQWVQKETARFKGMPIYFMLLNDINNRLHNDLLEYSVINMMDASIKDKFSKHYEDDKLRILLRIKNEIIRLQKERIYIQPNGFGRFKGRLSKELTNEFEKLYPAAIKFHFDALIKNYSIQTKMASTYKEIINLLLTTEIDSDTIHNYKTEVRNRIMGLLSYEMSTSWKCLNESYHITEPKEALVRNIYDIITEQLLNAGELNMNELYLKFTNPPYGLNNYSFMLMIALVISNGGEDICLVTDEGVITSEIWNNSIFANETNRLDLKYILNSKVIYVNSNLIEAKFTRLTKQIEDNRDVRAVRGLSNDLSSFTKHNVIPEHMKDRLKVARMVLDQGFATFNTWNTAIKKIKDFDNNKGTTNLLPLFNALDYIQTKDFESIFTKNNYDFLDDFKNELAQIKAGIVKYINDNFENYVVSYKCKRIEDISQFQNNADNRVRLLQKLGMFKEARWFSEHVKEEIVRVKDLQYTQNFVNDCTKFFANCKISKYTTYSKLKELNEESSRLIKIFNDNKGNFGKESINIKTGLTEHTRQIREEIEFINNQINEVYKKVSKISVYDDIKDLIGSIAMLEQRGVPNREINNIKELKKEMDNLQKNFDKLKNATDNREDFAKTSDQIKQRYLLSDSKKLAIYESSIDSLIDECYGLMSKKEERWVKKYIDFVSSNASEVYRWKEETKILPKYLSQTTIEQYKNKLISLEKVISKDKIKTVKHYFDQLTDEEKEKFISLITNK